MFLGSNKSDALFELFRVPSFEFRVGFELVYRKPETNPERETRNTKPTRFIWL